MSAQSSPPSKRWTRSYPPLGLLGIAVLVAIFVLPSSLNLPQSNPSTVLEYAPVPPEDDNPPPPADGNLSTLGLGVTDTIAKPVAPPPLPPPLEEGIGGRPNQKQCVGNPPRQTEDPTSPPCVPFFEGSNFGATYQGVDKDEITVLVYYDQAAYGLTGNGEPSPAGGTYVDINKAPLPKCPPTYPGPPTNPDQCDEVLIRVLRGFSRYFNQRFQTYGRQVHYWAYFTNADNAAERSGDAVANWEKLKPFAVIDYALFGGFNEAYDTAMNNLGVMTFSSTGGAIPSSQYRRNAPLAWGFYPDVEHWSKMYSSYICQKVAPYPVRRYGKPTGQGPPNGQKRKFGFWYTNDPGHTELTLFAKLVQAQVKKCGVTGIERTFSHSGASVNSEDTGVEATQAAAAFNAAGVTTVLYMGGEETRLSTALDAARYYPEIVVAGDLSVDSNGQGRVQNQNTWANAWAQTFHVRINRFEDSPGYRAYKEGDPSGGDNEAVVARDQYRDHFMLFQAIQVSGPKLTPESIDNGFHAIPERSSTDPFIAAFFFDNNDYTSVKDSAEQWWDTNGRPVGGGAQPGCWRMVREGKRFLAGKWVGKDDVFRNPRDPCTAYGGGFKIK